jgi:hypothetical protein
LRKTARGGFSFEGMLRDARSKSDAEDMAEFDR